MHFETSPDAIVVAVEAVIVKAKVKEFVEQRHEQKLCLLCDGKEISLGLCGACYQTHRDNMARLSAVARVKETARLIREGKLRDSRQGKRPRAKQNAYQRIAGDRGMNPRIKAAS